MLPFVSVDIETTGLDHKNCQILEVAAVRSTDYEEFRVCVKHPLIVGEWTAIKWHMDSGLLAECQERGETIWEAMDQFYRFLDPVRRADPGRAESKPKATAVGKNFFGFDYLFFLELQYDIGDHIRNRGMDPALLYLHHSDEVMPDSRKCVERAGFGWSGKHSALEDAKMVLRLLCDKIPLTGTQYEGPVFGK